MKCRQPFWLVAVALAMGAFPAAAAPPPQDTREIMGEVFGALQTVLPPSLDEGRFADPERRDEIRAALATLARHAERLEDHGARSEEGFASLARSLSRDANEVETRFAEGYFDEARFLLHGIVETCATCHARLPDPEDTALSMRFLEEEHIAGLALPERATLAMATRQFEAALTAQEAMLRSEEFDASSLELMGLLEDYLEVCVRVKGDFDRPARTLQTFSRRDDLRPRLRELLERWVADLHELAGAVEGLEAARALVQQAESKPRGGEPRAETVRYITASGALHRLVDSRPASDTKTLAEAYYWLGVIESRIGRTFWLSQTEPYLEASIRLDPGGPLAEEAYGLLDEYVTLGYTGSGGEHVPPDVARWLDGLYRLIDAARSRTAPERPRGPGAAQELPEPASAISRTKSPSVTRPTRRPASTTGRQPTFRSISSRAASCSEAEASTATTSSCITSLTAELSSSAS